MLSIYCFSAVIWVFIVFFTNNELRKFDINFKLYLIALVPIVNTCVVIIFWVMFVVLIVKKPRFKK